MKKILWIIIIIIVIAGGLFLLKKEKTTNSHQQITYQTIRVERGNIKVKILATGNIQPYTRVEVNSPVSGRIDKVAVDEGDRVKIGDVLVWIASEDRIALLDAAKSKLEEAQKGNDENAIKEAKLAYEIADKSYRNVSITTSISGEVIKRGCEPGQNISTSSVLFAISDKLVADVEVDEADIGKIKLGQEATIKLDAFPDEEIPAKVTKISRESRIVSNVTIYDVMVAPNNVPEYWASGMTANVEFVVESKDNVLVVPKSAIQEQEEKSFVMLSGGNRGKQNNSKPNLQEIETGISDGKMVEVAAGLNEGQEILLREGEGGFSSQTQGQSRPPAMRMMRVMRR